MGFVDSEPMSEFQKWLNRTPPYILVLQMKEITVFLPINAIQNILFVFAVSGFVFLGISPQGNEGVGA